MNAQPRITRVSWPVEGIDGKQHRRRPVVRPWEAPPEDALDPATGEPKHWEPQHVRERLRVAVDVLQRMPMPPGGRPAGSRSGMPEHVREFFESYGKEAAQDALTRPVRPTRHEISEMDRVLAWLRWLDDPRDPVILSAVAAGLHYRAIGKIMGLSHEWCRQRDRAALQTIARRLNGGGG